MLIVHSLPVLDDNYIFVVENPDTKEAAVIDPAEAIVVDQFLSEKKLKLTKVLCTHHHYDHVGGNEELKIIHGCEVYAFEGDKARIPGATHSVVEGQEVDILGSNFVVLFTPGHTSGHIAYFSQSDKILFCGDTLFSLGCGRLFEGTPEQMFNSLKQIRSLPPDTQMYCTHEYTKANLSFSLSLLPQNTALIELGKIISKKRSQQLPTIPVPLAQEFECNLFLNSHRQDIKEALNMPDASELEVFTRLRELKNSF